MYARRSLRRNASMAFSWQRSNSSATTCVASSICLCASVSLWLNLYLGTLALDRFPVFQLQGKDAAFAGVVVGIALPGRQAFQRRLGESQLFEPIDGLSGEDEDARHADTFRFLDEIRENFSPHAQVTVGGVRGDRGDFALPFPIVVKSRTRVDDIVDRVDDEVALVRHKVVFGPLDEDAFFH